MTMSARKDACFLSGHVQKNVSGKLLPSGVLLAFGVTTLIRILAVGSLHELLQLFLKAQVSGRGGHRPDFRNRRPDRYGSRLRRYLFDFLLFFSLCPFDRKIDFSLFVNFEDLYLHHLSNVKVIMNVLYKCVGNLRDMNQTAFPARKRDKSAEIHDACYLSLLYTADFNCHGRSAPS